jgi:hypothetical protein
MDITLYINIIDEEEKNGNSGKKEQNPSSQMDQDSGEE